jgi:acyl-CoA thioester hydrolase
MPKNYDAALLDAARYPHRLEVPTRFADVDINGHINNVAMAAVFEDARVRFFTMGLGLREMGVRAVLGAAYIDYISEAHYPAAFDVGVGVESIGRASWTISEVALQGGAVRALCRATLVCTDGERAQPLAANVRAVLERWLLK